MKKSLHQNQARDIRKKEGLSVNAIALRLGVSKSSVSTWVRDIVVPDDKRLLLRHSNSDFLQFHSTKRKEDAQLQRQIWRLQGSCLNFDHESLFVMGCALYWAEGKKSRHVISMANTDYRLLLKFVNFLRQYFLIKNQDICLYIRGYSNNGLSVDNLKDYWIKKLALEGIKNVNLVMDSDKRIRSGKKKKVHPYGIAEISINSTYRANLLKGAIQKICGLEDCDW